MIVPPKSNKELRPTTFDIYNIQHQGSHCAQTCVHWLRTSQPWYLRCRLSLVSETINAFSLIHNLYNHITDSLAYCRIL